MIIIRVKEGHLEMRIVLSPGEWRIFGSSNRIGITGQTIASFGVPVLLMIKHACSRFDFLVIP